MKYYIARIHQIRATERCTLYVDFSHVNEYNRALAEGIVEHYYRVLPFLTRGLQRKIAKYEPDYFKKNTQGGNPNRALETNGASASPQTDRLFAIAFYNLPLTSRIRNLRTVSIGQLLSISGTVTRTSEVRPELHLATFTCEACRTVISNVEQIFRYTEPTQCPNLTCGNRNGWRLDVRQSVFVDWQKVRIQENSSEIPTGSMPRTMDVILRGEVVDRAKAGEKCIFTGALIVVPDLSQLGLPGIRPEAIRDNKNAPRGIENAGVSGLKALGVRDLTYRLAFLACMVTPDDSPTAAIASIINAEADGTTEEEDDGTGDRAQDRFLQSLTPMEIEDLKRMVHSDHIYSRLVNSIAPTVYGHEIIKKGLLLQLMSGVHKRTNEGMALRGDINICIVGDPSTSKSQFLKYVCPHPLSSIKLLVANSQPADISALSSPEQCIHQGRPLQQLVSLPPSSRTKKPESSLSRLVHSCWLTMASAPSMSSTRWTYPTKWPSTKPWNSKPSPSPKPAFKPPSIPEPLSSPQRIP